MEIRLSPELAAAVERGIASGRYANAEEYVAEAIELLEEECMGESLAEQREKMQISLAEAEQGEVANEDQVRAEMQVMKAEWVSRLKAS